LHLKIKIISVYNKTLGDGSALSIHMTILYFIVKPERYYNVHY